MAIAGLNSWAIPLTMNPGSWKKFFDARTIPYILLRPTVKLLAWIMAWCPSSSMIVRKTRYRPY
jgi:hypothetical protein